MKTKNLLLVFMAFLYVAITGCGQYPDGPSFSLNGKTSRVTNIWKVEQVFYNESDATDAFNTLFPNYSIEFKKDNSYVETWSGGSSAEVGDWVFDGDKANILITPNGSSTASKSEILRLKTDELWLQEVDGSDITETHFVTK
jgi:hypothetical protein